MECQEEPYLNNPDLQVLRARSTGEVREALATLKACTHAHTLSELSLNTPGMRACARHSQGSFGHTMVRNVEQDYILFLAIGFS